MQYSHALLIGAGTGVVPNLSVLKQYIDKILTLRPDKYIDNIQDHHEMVRNMVEDRARRKVSCQSYFCEKKHLQSDEATPESIFLDKKAMAHTSRGIVYQFVPLLFFPPLGMLMFGLTLSWNLLPFEPTPFMTSILMYGTILFHVLYLTFTLVTQDFNSIFNYIDLIIVIISVVSDCQWTFKDIWGNFTNEHMIYYSILMGYMTFRSWSSVLNYNTGPHPIEHSNKRKDDLGIFEQLRFVWVTRDASAVSLILPSLESLWNDLCNAWGVDLARQICNISIHCTCKDEGHIVELKRKVENFNLYQVEGALVFDRPSIQQIITKHSLDRINDESLKASHTMFVFCGSSSMMSTIKQYKLLNDVGLIMTGNTDHQVDLIAESFSGDLDVKKQHYRNDEYDKRNTLKFRLSPKNTIEYDCSSSSSS